MRNFFSFYQRIVRRAIVVVPLALLLGWVCVVKAQPRGIERSLVVDEGAKGLNGRLESTEPSLQEGSNVVWPRIRNGVDGPKFGHDGGAEGQSRNGNAIAPIVFFHEKSRNAGQNNADEQGTCVAAEKRKEDSQLLFLVVVIIPLLPLFAQLLNTRRQSNVNGDA